MTPEERKRLCDELDSLRNEVEDLVEERHESRDWTFGLLEQVSEARAHIGQLKKEVAQRREQVLFFQKQQKKYQEISTSLLAELERKRSQVADLQDELEKVHTSWSWRIIAPARSLISRLGGKEAVGEEAPAPSLVSEASDCGSGSAEDSVVQDSAWEPPSEVELFLQEQMAGLDAFLASDEVLDFHPAEPPRVAVVLVLFNRAELTLACLRSLQQYADTPLELIVVDNASSDRTSLLLDRIKGAVILRNSENLHFLQGCNQAAERVESEYLLLLNNDAQLKEGAIEAALKVFDEEEKAGAVGAKIVLPGDRLQEAGSLVWNDGSCLGVCRGMSPKTPEANFRREVDYCSGAFLLTPTDVFRSLGGFDTDFSPAYYEEVDYCFRLRAAGYVTIYEPTVEILHVEFASSLDASGPVELQLRNRKTFLAKHGASLSDQVDFGPEHILSARYAPPRRPRVLYIDDRVPQPELGSGYPRAQQIVQNLVELGYEVTLIPLNFPHELDAVQSRRVIPPRVEVMYGCGPLQLREVLLARKGLYDVLWVSRPPVMALVDQCLDVHPELKEGLRVVYDAEAVFALRDRSRAMISGHPLQESLFERKLAKERQLLRHAEVAVSVTESESRWLCSGNDEVRRVTIGHAVPCAPTATPFAERSGILFVGNLQRDETPNVGSIHWFLQEVWPLVKQQVPEIEFHLVGPTGAESLKGLCEEGVVVHGRVGSLLPWYEQCRVFVAPTRFSAGIPLKVVEAAGHGIPCVVTGHLAEQLGWGDGEEVRAASGTPDRLAADFAEKLLGLYTDQDLWSRVRQRALEKVDLTFSPLHMKEMIRRAVGEVQ